jgi:hypothetical protein
MFVWQDVSRDWLGRPRPIDARLQGDAALQGAAQGSRDRSTLPLFRLTGKAPVKITRAKALPSTGRALSFGLQASAPSVLWRGARVAKGDGL